MKINSVFAKTALAAAIAGASFAATAGVLEITQPSILATEVFGDAKNSANESNLTAITLPRVEFFGNVGGDLVAKDAGVDGATVKLTLLGESLFAENYQDPNTWAAQGIIIEIAGVAIDASDVAAVDAGTGNDNTITITLKVGGNLANATEDLTAVAGGLTPSVAIQGLKVKRLKSQLQPEGGTASVTLEVRAIKDKAGVSLAQQAFENTPSTVAFVSTKGVTIVGSATDYTAGANASRGYIQVADAQQSFTDAIAPVANHRDDFDATANSVDQLFLGTLSLQRGKVPAGSAVVNAAGKEAGKETGTKFDFTGADTLTLSIAGSAPLAAYGLELRTDSCSNAGATAGRLAVGVVNPAVDPNVATFGVSTASTNLDAPVAWNLCANASVTGTNRIPQLSSLQASFSVDYGNVRYGKSNGGYEYGQVLRNGCQVTLFNVPNVAAADKAMIRLTNTSTKPGQVNAYLYLEDGTQVDNDALLLDNLPAHGTITFHTNANLANGVYLGDVLPTFATEDQGRARIVLQGAFPSCEALGMVRSPNGTLTNMTSTTNNDATVSVGTFGTSNTSN